RLSQGCFSAASDIRGQFTQLSPRELRRARRSRRFALRARRRWIAIPRLSFSGAVQDDADFLQGDEATIHHFVQPGKELFNALGGLDDLENDGQILGKAKDFVGVVDARATVARDAAKNGRTGETLDRKSTRLNSSHLVISYAVFCLKKKTNTLRNLLKVRSSEFSPNFHHLVTRP